MDNATYDVFEEKEKSIENLLQEYALLSFDEKRFLLGFYKKTNKQETLFFHTLQNL